LVRFVRFVRFVIQLFSWSSFVRFTSKNWRMAQKLAVGFCPEVQGREGRRQASKFNHQAHEALEAHEEENEHTQRGADYFFNQKLLFYQQYNLDKVRIPAFALLLSSWCAWCALCAW
jgi:hypothetical protein